MKLTTWLSLAMHGPTATLSPPPKAKSMPVSRLCTMRPSGRSRYSSLTVRLPASGRFTVKGSPQSRRGASCAVTRMTSAPTGTPCSGTSGVRNPPK